ncbi:PREDICTED: putative zinc finger protein 724-like [Chrysochloris asiatica]|uniref:Zinc finger protein 724-like n=1 Tax=Chrysochloris asiatica TaxID=185453 RepID=A0A9B0UDF2_CHRAS|nr:PREDICTED: putative zinc finger protein 724-like [Chrysochloris asiatica]
MVKFMKSNDWWYASGEICEFHGRENQRTSQDEHTRSHSRENSYECKECGKAFLKFSRLTQHMRFHSGEKPYECKECGKAFSLPKSLTRHKRRFHPGEKCNECGEIFNCSSQLTEHTRSHSVVKRYECEECGKTFHLQTELTQHKRTHSGDRPSEFKEFGKAFKRLEKHKKTHSGEKLYQSLLNIYDFTLERNRMNVKNVGKPLFVPQS